MKEFETYEKKVLADTDKDVVQLALECSSDYYRNPLFKLGEPRDRDFNYSLCYYNPELCMYQHCWGITEDMGLKEALRSFNYLKEQFIIRILDWLNIDYEVKQL